MELRSTTTLGPATRANRSVLAHSPTRPPGDYLSPNSPDGAPAGDEPAILTPLAERHPYGLKRVNLWRQCSEIDMQSYLGAQIVQSFDVIEEGKRVTGSQLENDVSCLESLFRSRSFKEFWSIVG